MKKILKDLALLVCACYVVFSCVTTLVLLCGGFKTPEPEPVVVVVESTFDTSVLDGWCGGPQGKIRMVGAWVYEDGVLEDETGNLWGWDGELDENGFYLLWIDDLGDDVVQNDEIVKLWQEK